MDDINIKVATAAERLGLSKVSVHKWVKKLGLVESGLAKLENGMVFLTTEALRVIEEAHREKNPISDNASQKASGKSAEKVLEPSREVPEKLFDQLTDRFDQEVRFLRQELTRRDETIQSMLARQAEERQRTDSIIMKMTHDLEGTRKAALAIEAKVNALSERKEVHLSPDILAKPPEPIKVWQPTPATSEPLRNLSWYQKAWIKFAYPERLRRHVEN